MIKIIERSGTVKGAIYKSIPKTKFTMLFARCLLGLIFHGAGFVGNPICMEKQLRHEIIESVALH